MRATVFDVKDCQSHGLNTRRKQTSGATQLMHINEATTVAIGRSLNTIPGTFEHGKGSVRVPRDTVAMHGGKTSIEAAEDWHY